MRGHRVAGPDGTVFSRRIVADGEDEIHDRRAGLGKLLPALRAQALGRIADACQQPERVRIDRTSGEAACRSEEHTSELQSLIRISYAVFCLKKKKNNR